MQNIIRPENVELMVANSILTTALLSNEVCIQTKGEFILQEEDYIIVVKNFQAQLAKKIVPIRTQDELRDEAKKYIADLLLKLNNGVSNEVTENGSSDNSESNKVSTGENG